MAEEQIQAETSEEVSRQEQATTEKVPYTPEEMKAFTPTSEIDMDRVPEAFRPVMENMTRDYKELQTDHTRKSQRLAELEKATPEPEKYFEDSAKDTTFKNYLKAPGKILADINGEIARLEAVIPDDGAEEYRKARREIAYWNGVKDEFSAKRVEISEARREKELAEAKLSAELGTDAATLMDYAVKELGFSEQDFKTRPGVRTAVKNAYTIAHAAELAAAKAIKPTAQKTAKTTGEAARGEVTTDLEEEMNLSVAERIARSEKRMGLR